MNKSQYTISLKKVKSLLSKHGLIKDIPGTARSRENSPLTAGIYDFIGLYRRSINGFNYDILLLDESILQFSYSKDQNGKPLLRYAYYQCPYEFFSYEQYLDYYDFSYEEIGEELKTEYEQELSESVIKDHFVHIRYDYSEHEYQLAVHPVSHLHIGHLGSIRIPIQMMITPYMFSLFVLKQCYYRKWRELIAINTFHKAISVSKTSCSILNTALFCDLDRTELYLV